MNNLKKVLFKDLEEGDWFVIMGTKTVLIKVTEESPQYNAVYKDKSNLSVDLTQSCEVNMVKYEN